MVLSLVACGKTETPDNQEPVTNTPDVNTEKDPTIETPAVTPNEKPSTFLINESFSVDEDPNAYERYLECVNRNADAITFPLWEQFSALGTFRTARITVVNDEANYDYYGEGVGEYFYSYVDPDSGTERIYRVATVQMKEGKEYTLQNRDGFPEMLNFNNWYLGTYSVMGYRTELFEEGDFTRYKGDTGIDMIIVDDTFGLARISQKAFQNITFIYGNCFVTISAVDVYFDSSLDCDIVCRLLHKDTYKEATQELMNPENAK